MEGLKARLSVLEVLVSQLSGKDVQQRGNHQGVAARPQAELQEAMNRAVGEKNLLQGEKERLERELETLKLRMEEMRRETERLRSRPCLSQNPVVAPSSNQQDWGKGRPAAGKRHTKNIYF